MFEVTRIFFTINKRSHQAASVQKSRELLEVEKKTRNDVEYVDQREGQQESPPLGVLIRIIHVTEERRPEDAQGEQEAEGETEEDGGEDGVGDDLFVNWENSLFLHNLS